MATEGQNLKNHARVVPAFHYGVFPPLLLNFLWAASRLFSGVTGDAVIQVLLSIGLLLMAVSLRTQILTVQDRVIRLEMRLRLAALLSAEQQSLIARMTHKQLVALRFASDAELPHLVQLVTSGQLTSQKEIKSQIREWQADFLRA
jgi:hypothetical protein